MLVAKSNEEVAERERAVARLMAQRDSLFSPMPPVNAVPTVSVPEPAPQPRAPVSVGMVDPEFDKLLPDTLQELPNNARPVTSAGLFEELVPTGLAPPNAEGARVTEENPFAGLLPDGLKALEDVPTAMP